MTSDLDIYRSAKLLVDQHGEDGADIRGHALIASRDGSGGRS